MQIRYTIFIVAFLIVSSILSFRCEEADVEEAGSITLTSPNGGENWQIGTTHSIKWTSTNISGDVKIEISSDNGNTFSTLMNGTPNDEEESWYITGPASTNVLLRISSLSDNTISDNSDDMFTLYEVITGPTNLQAAVTASHDITLTWQDQSPGEEGFIVERKIGVTGVWVERARVGANIVTYKDSNLATNRQYFYRVRAYAATDISGETASASKILGWVQQQSNTTQTLHGIAYGNAKIAAAVGDNGTILRTTNGDEWNIVASGTTEALHAVAFATGDHGVAVGAGGTILKTSDGGATWMKQTVGGSNYTFKGVDYAALNDVYAVGSWKGIESDTLYGTIYRSTDGGVNWGALFDQRFYNFEDVSFTQQDIGFVVGNVTNSNHEAIFKTTNRGLIWSKQSTESTLPLLGLHFLNSTTGTAVGLSSTILRTTNGGTTWADVPYSVLTTFRGVAFADINRGVIVGNNGFVLRTTDGGASWFQQSTGSTEQFNALYMNDANTQTIVGTGGVIVKTENGGAQ
ncbi:MAG: hypothetical protein EPO24_10960 [Bacteroidetes bacterium]|nr:MAG: hypothetical protein EPO24_10960 [Bacteroidota bacterium]